MTEQIGSIALYLFDMRKENKRKREKWLESQNLDLSYWPEINPFHTQYCYQEIKHPNSQTVF